MEVKMKKYYEFPRIIQQVVVQPERFIATSIISDDQEVDIQEQDKGVTEDFTFEGWD